MSLISSGTSDMTVLERYCRYAGCCFLLLLAFVGCTNSTSVTMQQRVTVSEPLASQGVMWVGSRSAAVLNSEHYLPVTEVLETAFSEAGFSTTDQKEEADHQAYLWFGKRRERREQFSNVTDGMNITTEYTWAMTLEVFSREAVGTSQQYGGRWRRRYGAPRSTACLRSWPISWWKVFPRLNLLKKPRLSRCRPVSAKPCNTQRAHGAGWFGHVLASTRLFYARNTRQRVM